MENTEKDSTLSAEPSTETIKFVFPVGPTINHFYGHNKFGGKYIKKDGKDYIETVGRIVRSSGFSIPAGLRCDVSIEYHLPDLRKRDLDNILKCLLDSLTKCGFWEDDSLINLLQVRRMPVDRANPRFEVSITTTMENPYESEKRSAKPGKSRKPKEGS